MSGSKLSEHQITSALHDLPGWTVENEKLHRAFQFRDFTTAFGFMTMSAIEIEKRNHHPEWRNVYNRVTVDLTTHDAGGITSKDVELATILQTLATGLA